MSKAAKSASHQIVIDVDLTLDCECQKIIQVIDNTQSGIPEECGCAQGLPSAEAPAAAAECGHHRLLRRAGAHHARLRLPPACQAHHQGAHTAVTQRAHEATMLIKREHSPKEAHSKCANLSMFAVQ